MKLELLDVKELDDYPLASGIEYYNGKIYLTGYDAGSIMVLGKNWKDIGQIPFTETSGDNTPPKGPETMTLLWNDKKPYLLAIGSGINEAHSRGLLVNLENNRQTAFDLDVYYDRLRASGIGDLNIESIALVYDYIVLANRGAGAYPVNHFIITSTNFWKKQKEALIQVVPIDFGASVPGMGISGTTYSDKHELLLLTTFTAGTPATEDNTLTGRSTLCAIENIYRKIGREKKRMKITELFDLPSVDEQFKGYKIESACIQSEKDHSMKLHLLANHDEAGTCLFKTRLWL